MTYNKSSDITLNTFLKRHIPAAQAAGSLSAFQGLSGTSYCIETPDGPRVLRQRNRGSVPRSAFARQYRALRQLPEDLAPRAWCLDGDWLLVDYLPGEVKTTLPPMPQLAALLYHLHRQPRFGWRLNLLALLHLHWQNSAASRRTLFWLQRLQTLTAQGEPQPLRLAPLHMDVHAGNIVWQENALRLIDWEYAGDGDIALELAAVWVDETVRRQLVAEWASLARSDEQQLWRQVRRWRPWVTLLMAGWYEQRYQQTQEQQFIALADDAWQQARVQLS